MYRRMWFPLKCVGWDAPWVRGRSLNVVANERWREEWLTERRRRRIGGTWSILERHAASIRWYFGWINCPCWAILRFLEVRLELCICNSAFGCNNNYKYLTYQPPRRKKNQWKIWYFAANYRRRRHFFEAIVLCMAFHRSTLIGEAERTNERTKILICWTGFAIAATADSEFKIRCTHEVNARPTSSWVTPETCVTASLGGM